MTSTEQTITVVSGLNHSGLLTIEAIRGGYETPLIDEYNLRGILEDIKAADAGALAEAMAERRARLNARKRIKVGEGSLEGVTYDIVEFEKI